MSVTTGQTRDEPTPEFIGKTEVVSAEDVADEVDDEELSLGRAARMKQMGAKRIGSLAIGIGVVGIVLNEMSGLDIVSNSSGVIDVSNIFSVAGSGLDLLVVGVIIAAAAVLLSLWQGF
jgi:hypothetical protein